MTVQLDNRESCEAVLNPDDLRSLDSNNERIACQINKTHTYVGCVANLSVKRGSIALSEPFAKCNGLHAGQVVSLSIIKLTELTTPIIVKPANSDDWEVIEVSAGAIEYNMLSQIWVLGPSLTFPIWTSTCSKPVFMTADSISAPVRLSIGSEVAVEARPRRLIDTLPNFENSFRARVCTEGFPDDSDADLLVNPIDAKSLSGSIVIIIQLPGPPLTVASNAKLVDPGFVLVSDLCRRRRGMSSGMRITITDYPGAPCFTNQVTALAEPQYLTEVESRLSRKLLESDGIVVGQDSWINLGFDCLLKFSASKDSVFFLNPSDKLNVHVKPLPQALISEKQRYPTFLADEWFENDIVTFRSSFEISSDAVSLVNRLPSFFSLVQKISAAINKNLVSDPNLPFVPLLVTGVSGKSAVALAALSLLQPAVSVVTVDCARIGKSKVIQSVMQYAVTNPPVAVLLRGVQNLAVDDLRWLDEAINKSVLPNRSLILIATADDQVHGFPLIYKIPAFTLKDKAVLRATECSTLSQALRCKTEEVATPVVSPIGGSLSSLSRELVDMISLPLKYPLICKAGSLPCGALIVGPSGCGKSSLVRSCVSQLKLHLEEVKGPELLDKYIGGSELAVRKVFERAAVKAPCVVFFDEIDALCPKRGSGSGVTDRVVNQLLCYLDGAEGRNNVFVIAATSRPDILDAALTRPGRLDRVILCGLPETLEELKSILTAQLVDFENAISVEVIDEVCEGLSDGTTGADVRGLLVDASIIASQSQRSCINDDDLKLAVARMRVKITGEAAAAIRGKFAKYASGGLNAPDDVGTRVVLS